MLIENARYHADADLGSEPVNVSITVTIDGIEMSVPINPDNRHYQAIQEWVAEGNTIAEAE